MEKITRALQLKDIYSKEFVPGTPIDEGAVESLASNSAAYSNLLLTNVKSYAIAGSWKPKAKKSYKLWKNIIGIYWATLSFHWIKTVFTGITTCKYL